MVKVTPMKGPNKIKFQEVPRALVSTPKKLGKHLCVGIE